jgi:hypothetical protein
VDVLARSHRVLRGFAVALAAGLLSPLVPLALQPAGADGTLLSIQVNPNPATIAVGQSQQFFATGTYLLGLGTHTHDITTSVTWTSTNTAAATVSNDPGTNGRATGVGTGVTTITATLGAVSGTAVLNVTDPVLIGITIDPPAASIAKGTNQQYFASGLFSDGHREDLTNDSGLTWASSNTGVATISNAAGTKGQATAVDVGVTNITATKGTVTSVPSALTVTGATLVSIAVNPPAATIAAGTTQQYQATGTYTDLTTQDLTDDPGLVWASSNTAVATISNAAGTKGLATGVAQGATDITATLASVASGPSLLTVTAATLVSIAVTPPAATVAVGLTQQYQATGTYTDLSVQDLTDQVTWDSSDDSVATISNATGSEGLATAVDPGQTTISATLGATSSTPAVMNVTAAELVGIGVTPVLSSVPEGLTEQYTATGLYSDASTQDITTSVTWISSDTDVASISNAAGTEGLATGLSVGTTDITATLGTVTSAPATLNVTDATLQALTLSPAAATIAKGLTQQFTANGLYSDGSVQDLTTSAAWFSSNPTVASISNAAGTKGLATGNTAGTVQITANVGAVSSTAPAVLTVTGPVVVAVAVLPNPGSVEEGSQLQFHATALYSDSSVVDITESANWTTGDLTIAQVSNEPGTKGLLTGIAPGTTTVRATDSASPVFGTAAVNVTGRPPLTITPNIGPRSTPVLMSNGTFTPGVLLVAKYKTGLAHPRGQLICIANAQPDGTINCSGQIPAAPKAGANGAHTVIAKIKGDTHASTNQKQSTTFTLTA